MLNSALLLSSEKTVNQTRLGTPQPHNGHVRCSLVQVDGAGKLIAILSLEDQLLNFSCYPGKANPKPETREATHQGLIVRSNFFLTEKLQRRDEVFLLVPFIGNPSSASAFLWKRAGAR